MGDATPARAQLLTGAAQGLDQLLAPVEEQRHDLRLAVHASVVHALAADRLRLDNDALDALARAVDLAEPETLISPFLGAGTERLRGLLERLVLLRPLGPASPGGSWSCRLPARHPGSSPCRRNR